MKHDHFIVPPGKTIRLKDYDPGFTSHYKTEAQASTRLRQDIKRLAKYQDVLYAQGNCALQVSTSRSRRPDYVASVNVNFLRGAATIV